MLRREPLDSDVFRERDRDLLALCAGLLTVSPPDATFSHITAARLYGMPVPQRLTTAPLHLLTAGEPPKRRGVVGHSWPGGPRRQVGGLPVVPPELAWLQLAPTLSRDELIVAGDYLVRRKRPLCTLASLGQLIADQSGRRGVAAARAALAEVRPGTDSPPESWMRLVIVRAGHPEPVVGYRAHHDGYFIGTPDLCYPDLRIAFEYQGAGHREVQEFESDIVRLELFHEAGWKVIQVTKGLLARPGWLAERTRRALAERIA